MWLAEFAPGGSPKFSSPLQGRSRFLGFVTPDSADSFGFFSLTSRANMNMNLDETPTTTCALHDLQCDAKARQHVPWMRP